MENRLKEIRENRKLKFQYIASPENLADIADRGLGRQGLRDNNLWWSGPEWLILPSDSWPIWKLNNMDDDKAELTTPEEKTCKIMYEAERMTGKGRWNKRLVSAKVSAPLNIDITRFSTLTKLLRVIVLILRFINTLKRVVQRSNNQMDSEKVAEAE